MTAKSARLRYKNDPTYRARAIEKAKRQYEVIKKDRTSREMLKCTKQIYNIRESLKLYAGKMERLEKRLFYYLERRKQLKDKKNADNN